MSRLLLVLALVALVAVSSVAGRPHPQHHHHHHQRQHHKASSPSSLDLSASLARDLASSEPRTSKAAAGITALRARVVSELRSAFTAPAQTTLQWQVGQNHYTFTNSSWGGDREFYVYVPASYTPSKAVSLVYAIHGLGDQAVDFGPGINMTWYSDKLGFILVYPQGAAGLLGTAWNAGRCCATDPSIDDVGFLMWITAAVQSTFTIRPESIHTMGFSNGGFMSERLGCEMSTTFRSIASVSGDTILNPGNEDAFKTCDAAYASPTHVLHVHGTFDLVVPFTGDSILGFGPIPDDMAAWTKRNGCQGNYTQTFSTGSFSNQLWTGCNYGNTEVELVVNAGGGHVYPQIPDYVFDATDYIIAFFQRVTPGGL